MKTKQTVSGFLTSCGWRHAWVIGSWPPMAKDFVPLNSQASQSSLQWVDNIYKRIFDISLPLKKNANVEFIAAALRGYSFASLRLEFENKASDKSKISQNIESHLRCITGAAKTWPVSDVRNYLSGFAYGIKCQETSLLDSNSRLTWAIAKAFVENQTKVNQFIKQKATVEKLACYIADFVPRSGGLTYGEFFRKNSNDDLDGKSPQITFLKNFPVICNRLGIPLRPRGRPSKT
jgi:hypothetical protein